MDTLHVGADTKQFTFPINEQNPEGFPGKIPVGAGINIEKKLPYLVVNRSAGERERKIISNESSYIWVEEGAHADELIKDTAMALANEFGTFILFEFWINDDNHDTFHIYFPEGKAPATVQALEEGFEEFRTDFPQLKIQNDPEGKRSPKNANEFFTKQEFKKTGILKIGVEIPDFFRDPLSGYDLPLFFRRFRKQFSNTVKKAVYEFIRVQTSTGIENYHLLGRKMLNKAVWKVDKALAEIEDTFEFLLMIAPTNSDESWHEFKESGYNTNPTFHYRLLPLDPEKLKQKLYHIDIDAVDDPSMAFLFREKREELDTQITMLNERNSKGFMFSSIRMFSSIDDSLLQAARNILENVKPGSTGKGERTDCRTFAMAAREEIAYYKEQNELFESGVEIRDDMVGIMVSRGRVLIGEHFNVASERVKALLQHEVGTHVLTYFNGCSQPLHLLRSGLAGYEELQEGIAVLSEYLVGGLTASRLRTLAARVTAAHDMTEGAEFKDVFNQLKDEHAFNPVTAYDLTTRIFQSGGYTKDIIYLRGIIRLLDYLQKGLDLDILYIGKIAESHVPVIKELKNRQILKQIPLFPRFLYDEECLQRLEKVKKGLSPTELIST